MQPDINESSGQSGQFDFFMKDTPKAPKKRFKFGGLPKPVMLFLAGLAALILLIGFAAIFGGPGASSFEQLEDLMARQQEIIRAGGVAKPSLKTAEMQNIQATTEATLATDQTQISQYLKNNKYKVNTKKLVVRLNRQTDAAFRAAAQNNNLDKTYAQYLRENLNNYRAALQVAYRVAGKNAKTILDEAYRSAGLILTEPLLLGDD